jgi:glycosyltransferase involved in cell wall biosynthesis
MKASLKFSVVTPSYQQGRFIDKTIQSVLSQSYENFEYIIFDAKSDDETIDILKAYEDKIDWISENDDGQADAVNKGILKATGDVICWLNSDDVYEADAFRQVAKYFEDNPDMDIVYGRGYHIDTNNNFINEYPTTAFDANFLKENCFICQPALFFRKCVIEKIGLLDKSLYYCMDYEFWLRAADKGLKFGYLEEVLAHSRLYKDNKTLRNRQAVHKEIVQMFLKKFGKVPDRWILNYAHVCCYARADRKKELFKFIVMLFLYTNAFSLYYNKNLNRYIFIQLKNYIFNFLRKDVKAKHK